MRPSSAVRLRYLMQRSASSVVSILINAKPRDSLLRGSVTKLQSTTFPSFPKYFLRSLEVTLVDKPVTYKLFPGLDAFGLLERLCLDLGGDLEPDLGGGDLDFDLDRDLHRWPLGDAGPSSEGDLASLESDI